MWLLFTYSLASFKVNYHISWKKLSYTLTSTDWHAVLPYQDVVGALLCRDCKGVNDRYVEQKKVNFCYAKRETALGYKCILDGNHQETVGTLCYGDEKGVSNQYVSQDQGEFCVAKERDALGCKCILDAKTSVNRKLIRRLTPLECERLQGFPDGWTEIEKCSDSARYKALGNSVAVPCVDFVMQAVAFVLEKMYLQWENEKDSLD